jgi:2-haloacid dehalogenase
MPRAFVFDAYGTLFDVHAAIGRHRVAAGPDADRFSDIWRTKQLEYTWTLTLAGRYVDFWTLTERALDFALARFSSVDRALRPKLLDSYRTLDAFPDTRAALRALKGRGHATAILSNGSPEMLTTAVEAAGIGNDLDDVLSVDSNPHLQAARRGLRARHCALQDRAERSCFRFVEPLGRDGRRRLRLSDSVGQSRQRA